MHKQQNKSVEQGFALLMSLVVVGVVLSVGLSLLDLSIKQVRLSSNAKDSEVAFHAANAGMECARYVRRENASAMEAGAAISPSCFGASPESNTRTDLGGGATVYEYWFSWGGVADPRCTNVVTMVATSSPLAPADVAVSMETLKTHMPGFPDDRSVPNDSELWSCPAGARCTVVTVRGYNKVCDNIINGSNTYGVVEREVLLQY